MKILPFAFIMLFVFPTAGQTLSSPNQVSKGATDRSVPSEIGTKSQRSGVISGRVVGEDGQPISNARVIIYTLNANRQRTVAKQIETDLEGYFRASGLPPVVYQVSASIPAYVSGSEVAGEFDGNPGYHRIGDTVNIMLRKGGVITGRVIDEGGEPIIGVAVQAVIAQKKDRPQLGTRSFLTDDRGFYRIYGLPPGAYLVMVNTNVPGSSASQNALHGDQSTYYPASTRDDAVEIAVNSGVEVSGIDIRHRGERGTFISGSVSGLVASTSSSLIRPFEGVMVILSQAPGGSVVNTANITLQGSNNGFTFYGLPDGEYELIARQMGMDMDGSASAPRRVAVKGKEVTGIELKLTPLGSIAGHFVLEPRTKTNQPDNCKPSRISTLAESLISMRRDTPSTQATDGVLPPLNPFMLPLRNSISENGEFILRSLYSSHYRLIPQLPTEDWYVRTITLPATNLSKSENDVGLNGIALKQGEKVTGMKILVAQDAAGLKGRVVAERNAKLPPELRIHLLPIEREAVANVLRYAEIVTSNGSFTFTNIAPGKYWLLAQAAVEDETNSEQPRTVAWNIKSRIRLRQAAERAGVTIDLSRCQRVTDLVMRYSVAK